MMLTLDINNKRFLSIIAFLTFKIVPFSFKVLFLILLEKLFIENNTKFS